MGRRSWHTGAVPATISEEEDGGSTLAGRIALVIGPLAGIALALITHPDGGAWAGLSREGALTLGLLVWMAMWWMLEAAPMPVTALLPVILLPLVGVGSFRENACHYADSVIFLFAGGGVMALALERHGLTERFTRGLLCLAGRSPARVVVAVFVGTAIASAFMSNAAVASMMIPIVSGLAVSLRPRSGVNPEVVRRSGAAFITVTMLVVAYASTIGGTATVIGSPPNAIAAKWLADSGVAVDFVRWARFATPLACVMGGATLLVLLRLFPLRGIDCDLPDARTARLGAPAWITLGVFLAVVVCWITPPSWNAPWRPTLLADGVIAVIGAALLLSVPSSVRTWAPSLPWSATRRLPWGVYILFGGGLSLADAMQRSGLSQAIGDSFTGLGGAHAIVALAAIVAAMVFASEIASNTALTATAVPIVGALAPALGLPAERLVIAVALGASMAFMLPVGTPPNALVYATGRVAQRDMVRAGLILNIVSITLITLFAHTWL